MCGIPASGTISVQGTNNLSLSTSDAQPLYETVSKAMMAAGHMKLSSSGCVNTDGTAVCIAVGQSAYLTYAAGESCVNGTLNDCDNGPVPSGTALTICGQVGAPYGGQVGTVNVTNISDYQHNPALSTKCSGAGREMEAAFGLVLGALAFAVAWQW